MSRTAVYTMVAGSLDSKEIGGWEKAYNVQYLSRSEYRKHVREWFKAIEDIGPELWRLFGAAMEKELTRMGVKHGARLIFMPSYLLGALPLGLAQDNVTGRRISEMYEFVEAPSLLPLLEAADRVEKKSALTLGAIINPTGEIARLALPFTEFEGAFVASHFPPEAVTLRTKSDASPELALTALANKSYWHLASHGFFDRTDPTQTGLLLRDENRRR